MSTTAETDKSRRTRRRSTEEFKADTDRLVLDDGKMVCQVVCELYPTESEFQISVLCERTEPRVGWD